MSELVKYRVVPYKRSVDLFFLLCEKPGGHLYLNLYIILVKNVILGLLFRAMIGNVYAYILGMHRNTKVCKFEEKCVFDYVHKF